MPGNHGLITPEQLGNLVQGQPDRLPLQAHVQADLAVGGHEQGDFSAGLGVIRFIPPTSRMVFVFDLGPNS